jgi:hypothetical protein
LARRLASSTNRVCITAVVDDTIDITPQAIPHAYRDIATVPSGCRLRRNGFGGQGSGTLRIAH